MFLIRMAIRLVRRVGKLVKNVKPIAYPVSSVLFANCILSNKSWKNVELGQESQESLNLKHKLSLEHKLNSITENSVRSTLQTLMTTFKLMKNLNADYRALLKKLISVYEEILQFGNIKDISDTKLDSLLELQNEVQTKKEHIELMLNYIYQIMHLINHALVLSTLCIIEDVVLTVEQQTEEVLDKLREEDENNSKLERAYWHVQQQCIEKTKDTSDSEWFNVLFWSDKLIRVNFSKH